MSDYERFGRDLRAELTEHVDGADVRSIVCVRCGRRGYSIGISGILEHGNDDEHVCRDCRELDNERMLA